MTTKDRLKAARLELLKADDSCIRLRKALREAETRYGEAVAKVCELETEVEL